MWVSLFAIIVYFWRDVLSLIGGVFAMLGGKITRHGRLAIYIVLATIPAVLFGLFLKQTGAIDAIRADAAIKLQVVGWAAIIYGAICSILRIGSARASRAWKT